MNRKPIESLAKTIDLENGTTICLDKCHPTWLNEFRLCGEGGMDEYDGSLYLSEGAIILPNGKMIEGY